MVKPNKIDLEWGDYIKSNIRYDPETGLLWWKDQLNGKRGTKRNLEKPVGGSANKYGHSRISLKDCGKRVRISCHRVAWFLYYNHWPEHQIDHVNGVANDNRIKNLREASSSQNNMNRQKASTFKGKAPSSKYKGVSWDKSAKKWKGSIAVGYKRKSLGNFDTEEQAALTYNKFALEYFGEFAVLNDVEKGVCNRD